MTGKQIRTSEPAHPVAWVGVAAFAAGGLLWLWFGEWRWTVTGGVIFLATLTIAGISLQNKRPGS